MARYFTQLVPGAHADKVETASVCDYNDTWYATVLFEDGMLYHYELDLSDSSVKLDSQSTWAQRKSRSEYRSMDLECIGSYHNTMFPWDSFDAGGAYRFEIGADGVVGQVRKSIVINRPFDETVKTRLRVAAMAIQNAIKLHRQFVPVEPSWGVTS
ncbi:hypothetical protein KTD31_00535 [Burkholderia multivorans]|jgi:hypothetical protein|uniref:hypothetical protein n=1 Tax=Burkholderia multivorans TaxID=87883 RepID=UPI001C21E144|nr:hypothetical protein [Burkholderia multivorans]MBU9199886.1 hypothetical protein [Burkholderia multivorans]MDN8078995.1 hypothetical protein [Burkholderia multivorans]